MALPDNEAMIGNLVAALGAVTPHSPVVIAGSSAQYGMGLPHALSESAPTNPISPYGALKVELEARSLALGARSGVRVIWARSFNHLGPGQGLDAPVPSWARQVALAELEGSGTLRTGRLDAVRDFLDVRDVVDAYLNLAFSDVEGVVNVCSGRPTTLRRVAETLIAMSSASIEIRSERALERPRDPPYVVGDPSRLHALIGWTPRIELERTLADVLEEWRAVVRQHEAEPAPRRSE